MDGSGLGANDWTEMELKKRAYPVVTLGSAALQGRIAVESGDSIDTGRWVLRTGPDGVGTASGARRAHAGRA